MTTKRKLTAHFCISFALMLVLSARFREFCHHLSKHRNDSNTEATEVFNEC